MKNEPTAGSDLRGVKLSANPSRNDLKKKSPVHGGKAFLARSLKPETNKGKLM